METFIIIWIACGIIASLIAAGKGNSGCFGFILGFLLGPIGIIIALVSSTNEEEMRRQRGETKKCPYCAEYIKKDAIVCRYCGRSLADKGDFDISRFQK